MKHRLSGIFPPIPTTFDERGDVDVNAMTGNVRRWMTTGLAGILALGSNGEAGLLDDAESDRVVRAGGAGRWAARPPPALRNGPRVAARDDRRHSTRCRSRRRRRPRTDAVVLQIANDGRGADQALHGGRRRVTRSRHALQPSRPD